MSTKKLTFRFCAYWHRLRGDVIWGDLMLVQIENKDIRLYNCLNGMYELATSK